jgi:hypothetical protein
MQWGGLSGCHRCVEGAQHYKSLPPYEEDLQLLRQFPEHDLSHVCLACRRRCDNCPRILSLDAFATTESRSCQECEAGVPCA